MALNAYLKLRGEKLGEVKGSVSLRGREGRILVIGAEHGLQSPRDAATGVASGKRIHKPFVITKELDKSSPLLYQMCAVNENVVEWELQFWGPAVPLNTGTGAEVQRYTVKLINANIVDIKFHMPNSRNPELQRYSEYEEVSFIYERIEWIWTDGGITAQDDWAERV